MTWRTQIEQKANLDNMTLLAIPGKIPETKRYFLIFYPSPNIATKPTEQTCSNSIFRIPLQISTAHFFFFFIFNLPLKLRVVYLRNKQMNWVTNFWNFTNMFYCFCCYVIKSADRPPILLSVIWNPLLVEINLFQIMTLSIKREKVCAVCPYLLFYFIQSDSEQAYKN